MAQTKRKRRTKHRGTAAGTIEARGRTSRRQPQSDSERKAQARSQARERRLNTPPTWKGSFQRSAFAAVALFVLFGLMSTHASNRWTFAAFAAVVALLIYTPLSYYLETALFRRRQRKKRGGA